MDSKLRYNSNLYYFQISKDNRIDTNYQNILEVESSLELMPKQVYFSSYADLVNSSDVCLKDLSFLINYLLLYKIRQNYNFIKLTTLSSITC